MSLCDLIKETEMKRSTLRLIAFGSASTLTRGHEMGTIPEPDFGTYRPLA